MEKFLKALKDYFRGSYSEMKKVVWPNKKQTISYTIIVILMSIFVAVFFALLDYIFSTGLGTIIN